MNKLNVDLTDCYGISKLTEEFDFTKAGSTTLRHSQTQLIYAQNGVMKSSFAKTFKNISEGDSPKELVYDKPSFCVIEADGVALSSDSIFVVESKARYFESDKMATLLADKATQAEYLEIVTEIDLAVDNLLKFVASKIRIKSLDDVKSKFDAQFGTNDENRILRIVKLKDDITKADSKYLKVDYKLFEDKRVTDFLDKTSTIVALKSYFQTYEKLLEESTYFKKGVFDYINALNSYDAIDKNNFLKADNKIVLSDGTIVTDAKELERLFLEDKDRIFNDPELKKQYNALDKDMQKNAQVKDFRSFIALNQDLIPILQNYKLIRTYAWYAYFQDAGAIYSQFVEAYENTKDDLKRIYKTSESLETEWQSVVDRFNRSFDAPFVVKVKNKKDSILNQKKPVLEFDFSDGAGRTATLDVQYMNEHILSTGESRALYILCVMFEIESRKRQSGDHLIIFDDIADSFDYKNKYAIIEYLHETSRNHSNGIHMIIMTHNFDFFRSVQMRLWGRRYREKTRIATRTAKGEIQLTPVQSFNDFDRFRQEINTNEAIFIATAAFARNLIDYAHGHNTHYDTLTSALHIKPTTKGLLAKDVLIAISQQINGVDVDKYGQKLYLDILRDVVGCILKAPSSSMLEQKIVIAISLRLTAETYMLSKLIARDSTYVLDATKDQTAKLFEDYIDIFTISDNAYVALNGVMLMTPESIHINSFMYEPLLDMSLDELIGLHGEVGALIP